MDFLGPRNRRNLLRVEKNTSETIKEDCFCPLATALRCPLLQKKETNLNVKVSIINHLGEKGAPCESRQSIGMLAANKVPCTLVGVWMGAMGALLGQMRRRV